MNRISRYLVVPSVIAVATVAGLSGVTMLATQSRAEQASGKMVRESRAYLGARNLAADGVALSGYSPVSYLDDKRAQLGSAEFAVENAGVTYYLTSAEQVKTFNANPDKYQPQFGGWCAYGMVIEDKFPIDPTHFKVTDGKLYVFLNNPSVDALAAWNKGDEQQEIAKATAHWKKVSGN